MKKIIIIIIIIVIAGAGLLLFFRKKNKLESTADSAASLEVKVERGDIILKVSTTGRVVANLDVEIKSKASGEVIKLPYDISDEVKQGELLVELDPVDEQRNVAQKEASLEAAKAKLTQSKENLKIAMINYDTQKISTEANLKSSQLKYEEAASKLKRNEDLFSKMLISKEELDATRTTAQTAKGQLDEAIAAIDALKTLEHSIELKRQDIILSETSVTNSTIELDIAKRRLNETKIYAPMDGVVTARTVQIGQIIASGISNVGGGTSILTLSDLSHTFVIASIDESDIGKVKIGQNVLITADAFAGRRFNGKVVRIATKGTNQSNVIVFDVKIEVFGEGNKMLKPEMTANVEILADRKENVLTLPNEAIKYGDEYYYVDLLKKSGGTKETKQIASAAPTQTESGGKLENFNKQERGNWSESDKEARRASFRARMEAAGKGDSMTSGTSEHRFGSRRSGEQFASGDKSLSQDKASNSERNFRSERSGTMSERRPQFDRTSSSAQVGNSSASTGSASNRTFGGDKSNTERRQIEIGITDGLKTEIISGVDEGETVMLSKNFASKWASGNNSGDRRQGGGSNTGFNPRTARMIAPPSPGR